MVDKGKCLLEIVLGDAIIMPVDKYDMLPSEDLALPADPDA